MKNSTGPIIAMLIFLTWLTTLIGVLSLPFPILPLPLIPVAVLWMTFLYTGLFITAHDAMHGTVWRGHPGINRWIGRILLFLYALFNFGKVRRKHFLHHKYPGTVKDPDYHDTQHSDFLHWYMKFMWTYMTPVQLIGMALLFNGLHHIVHIPLLNLIIFWVFPSLLSTLQLFYFGTYLTHREPADGYDNPHHAQSNAYPVWLSFLTCYHFGYHREHHEYPKMPWWRLPTQFHAPIEHPESERSVYHPDT